MAAITRPVQSASPNLRPFDVRHDLTAVADLVELCFAETLDSDGRHYIRQMRSAARSPSYLLWAAAVAERVPLPLSGYVWEENGYLAGNLSLIPFNPAGRRIYLIANVAVDPAYRRRGIARALTSAAMQHVKKRGADSVWLHVRADNSAAFNLYTSLGFEERTRRTTWESSRADTQVYLAAQHPDSTKLRIVPRHSRFWSKQCQWLKRVYPPETAWHMTFNLNALRPGLWGAIHRLLTGTQIRQLAVLEARRLIGVLAWQPLNYRSDQLWLAADPENEDKAIRALLSHLQGKLPYRRDLAIEYPANRSFQAFRDAGFEIRQTLIWMEKDLRR